MRRAFVIPPIADELGLFDFPPLVIGLFCVIPPLPMSWLCVIPPIADELGLCDSPIGDKLVCATPPIGDELGLCGFRPLVMSTLCVNSPH